MMSGMDRSDHAEITFTEMELCRLVQRTLEKAITPDTSPQVQRALCQFGLRLLDEAAGPRRERNAQMKREGEEFLSRLRARLSGGDLSS
jgi:hypothetical protein